jgi:nucleoside-diphosphate-sugar epimerase
LKAFLTGATGFLGGRVAASLRARGDEVVALARSLSKGGELRRLGCDTVEGDLADKDAIRAGLDGCDAAFHIAAVYRVGVSGRECAAMYEANVRGTERVLEAGADAGVARIVYVSTVGVFGNTRGRVVDEGYERPPGDFLSCYDETKFLAHRHALRLSARGAPIVIVQPGGIYGPGDHSEIGGQIARAAAGRLPFKIFPDLGFTFVHVDDAAHGVLLAHDGGAAGASYVLGGEITTLGRVIDTVCDIVGRKPPRMTVPASLVRLGVPLGRLVGRVTGLPANLREVVASSDGVTYWATDARARRELGYRPRGLRQGLEETVTA